MAKRGAETEEGREKSQALAQEWVRELEGGLDSLDENMSRLRERLVLAIDEMEEAGEDVTAEDVSAGGAAGLRAAATQLMRRSRLCTRSAKSTSCVEGRAPVTASSSAAVSLYMQAAARMIAFRR